MGQNWFELQLKLHDSLREPVINRLFELGAEGVDESKETVRAFFDEGSRDRVTGEMELFLTSLAEMYPQVPRAAIVTEAVVPENWAERYKEFYHAQKLTHLFYLTPAWQKDAEIPDGMIPIVMEPGQAFGTGLHASTTLAMSLLEHTIEQYAEPRKLRLVDIGTGTGILAIAASKLGIAAIEATDIDPIAVTTAAENFALNGCSEIKPVTTETRSLKGPFDVILSNILLETHKQLASDYFRLLAPGGHIVLSGLLGPQRNEIIDVMTSQGFIADGDESLQEWTALVFRKQG
jgi:ribosomal protein L11 methyltransferase